MHEDSGLDLLLNIICWNVINFLFGATQAGQKKTYVGSGPILSIIRSVNAIPISSRTQTELCTVMLDGIRRVKPAFCLGEFANWEFLHVKQLGSKSGSTAYSRPAYGQRQLGERE